jgi:hypothetical protein
MPLLGIEKPLGQFFELPLHLAGLAARHPRSLAFRYSASADSRSFCHLGSCSVSVALRNSRMTSTVFSGCPKWR